MIPTKDKIMEIIEEHADTISSADINAVANAIAAQLTLPHRMSEFVTVNSFRGYNVPDASGQHNVCVWTDEDQIICWDSKNRRCYDSDGGGNPCLHVQAVKLHLARQEAT